jgi:hypothetical protein
MLAGFMSAIQESLRGNQESVTNDFNSVKNDINGIKANVRADLSATNEKLEQFKTSVIEDVRAEINNNRKDMKI